MRKRFFTVDFQHRQVCIRIAPYHISIIGFVVIEGYFKPVSKLNYMIIGYHISVFRDDYSGTKADHRPSIGLRKEEPERIAGLLSPSLDISFLGFGFTFSCLDMDYGRRSEERRVGKECRARG